MGALALISQILLLLLGIFLMIVILLQRGRGGGLAGALGGMGGQSAFGTKAGDVFTRITIVLAIIWVAFAGGSGYFLRAAAEQYGRQFQESAEGGPFDPELDPGPGTGAGTGLPALPDADAGPDADGTPDGSVEAAETPPGSGNE